jgi:hypothetical protein
MNKELKNEILGYVKNLIVTMYRSDLEDYWESYNDDIDLNIWIDEEDNLRCCAYDVIDNRTVTDTWLEIM